MADTKGTIKELGFKPWFTEVFWYHYKWWVLGIILGVVAATSFAVSVATQKNPQFSYVIATQYNMGSSDVWADFDSKIQDLFPGAYISPQLIIYGSAENTDSDGVPVDYMTTTFNNSWTTLYILSEPVYKVYADQGYFASLQSLGLTGDGDDYALVKPFGPLPKVMEGNLYMVIRAMPTDGHKADQMQQAFADAKVMFNYMQKTYGASAK